MRHFKIINSIIKESFKLKSFTLLEMLIVIGIIGVLVAMATVSYSTSQRKARDAKRKQDLKAIQNAFEQYYSICGYKYPATIPEKGQNLVARPTTCPSLSNDVLIIKMPADPLGGNYSCVGTCNENEYTICSPQVNGSSRLESGNCVSGSECCVSNQQ